MKNIIALSLITAFAAVFTMSCSDNVELDRYDEAKSKVSIQQSEDLLAFMKRNPRIAKAGMRTVRKGSGGGSSAFIIADNAKLEEANQKLDPTIHGFTVKKLFDIGMRFVAVYSQFVPNSKEYEGADEPAQAPSGLQKSYAMISANTMVDSKQKASQMTCEEIMKEPVKYLQELSNGKITEAKIIKWIDETDQNFKSKINACDHLSAGAFAKCNELFEKTYATVNKEITCAVKSADELEKRLGRKLHPYKKQLEDCVAAFRKCHINLGLEEGEDEASPHSGEPITMEDLEKGDQGNTPEKAKPAASR